MRPTLRVKATTQAEIEKEVREKFGEYADEPQITGGSVDSETAGTSGFIIGKTLKATYKGYPDCCCDFSDSKIGFMAFYVVLSEIGKDAAYTISGTGFTIPGPVSSAQHELWHTDGPTFDYHYYERLYKITLVRRMGYAGAAKKTSAFAKRCAWNAAQYKKPESQEHCQKILEACVEKLFFGVSPQVWIAQHGFWHVGASTLHILDNSDFTWDPEEEYRRLEKWWKPA